VVKLAWSEDAERYVGGTIDIGMVFHSGQVKGDDADEKGYHVEGWA
jgi:hypothetical protein